MPAPYVEYSRWSPCLVCGYEFRACKCPEGWTPDPSEPRSPILVEMPSLGQKLEHLEAFRSLSVQDKAGVLCAITMTDRWGSEYDWLPRPIEYYDQLAEEMGLIKRYPID